jgi:hypothetical protein
MRDHHHNDDDAQSVDEYQTLRDAPMLSVRRLVDSFHHRPHLSAVVDRQPAGA